MHLYRAEQYKLLLSIPLNPFCVSLNSFFAIYGGVISAVQKLTKLFLQGVLLAELKQNSNQGQTTKWGWAIEQNFPSLFFLQFSLSAMN